MISRLCCLLSLLSSLAALPAQQPGPEWHRPEPAGLADAGLQAIEVGEMVVGLMRPEPEPEAQAEQEAEAPLPPDKKKPADELRFPEPVSDLEIGRLPDGGLVVLAGGLRESLTVYLIHGKLQAAQRMATGGGRRLRSAFQDGLGSWPLVAGPDLWMFCYESGGELSFRARTVGRNLASRELPLELAGFEPDFDAASFEVVVRFAGLEAPDGELRFPHPRAPRLAVEGLVDGAVDFGATPVEVAVERVVELSNVGGFGLRAELGVEPAEEFELSGESVLQLEPGQSLSLTLRASAGEAGERRGRLEVLSAVPGVAAALELRALVEAPEPEPQPEPEPPPPLFPEVEPTPVEPAPGPAPVVRRSPLAVPAPQPEVLAMHWVESGLVLQVALREPHSAGVVALRGVRSGIEVVAPVGSDGRLELELRAQALDTLELAFLSPDGSASRYVPLGKVPLDLRANAAGLLVRSPADRPFAVVQLTAEGRVLQAWRGRASVAGEALVPAAFLGSGDETLRLALVTSDPESSVAVTSDILELTAP